MLTESLETDTDGVIIDGSVYSRKLMKKIISVGLWFKIIDETISFKELWKIHLIKKEYENESKTM